jgi:hypothetical protein
MLIAPFRYFAFSALFGGLISCHFNSPMISREKAQNRKKNAR